MQYKAEQVEPTRDMLELDLSMDIGQEHVAGEGVLSRAAELG